MYPVSTGRPALPTLGGVHIVLTKWAVKEMKSWTLIPPIPQFLPNGKKNPAAYDENELWATRISNAGAFVHYQPGTLKQQGIQPPATAASTPTWWRPSGSTTSACPATSSTWSTPQHRPSSPTPG